MNDILFCIILLDTIIWSVLSGLTAEKSKKNVFAGVLWGLILRPVGLVVEALNCRDKYNNKFNNVMVAAGLFGMCAYSCINFELVKENIFLAYLIAFINALIIGIIMVLVPFIFFLCNHGFIERNKCKIICAINSVVLFIISLGLIKYNLTFIGGVGAIFFYFINYNLFYSDNEDEEDEEDEPKKNTINGVNEEETKKEAVKRIDEKKKNDNKIKFCSKCGNAFDEDDVFCKYCGNKIKK